MPLTLTSLLTYTRVTGHGDEPSPVVWIRYSHRECFKLGNLETVLGFVTPDTPGDLIPACPAFLPHSALHWQNQNFTCTFLSFEWSPSQKGFLGSQWNLHRDQWQNHCRQSAPLWGTRNSSGFCLFWKKQLNCEHATSYIINVDIWLPNTDKFVGVFDATTFFMELRLFLALLFH